MYLLPERRCGGARGTICCVFKAKNGLAAKGSSSIEVGDQSTDSTCPLPLYNPACCRRNRHSRNRNLLRSIRHNLATSPVTYAVNDRSILVVSWSSSGFFFVSARSRHSPTPILCPQPHSVHADADPHKGDEVDRVEPEQDEDKSSGDDDAEEGGDAEEEEEDEEPEDVSASFHIWRGAVHSMSA